ncbi:MAG TPA: toll/interleukin-1 receptor domain-containing protein, partial [Casimicrobiaceae bacterium]|nr:toll/interleukin-1 receptor domain-containing protein [Casimicrobiaceae bacterium]
MADIFISYAREDEATAIHLRDVLVEQGWDIWRDREGILTGTSWEQSIEQALNQAKCVIVLWSRSALSSHFVRDEASVARNAGKLVPVQIDSIEIPLGFRGIQTSNLVGWDGSVGHPEFRKLIRALEERVGQHTPRPPSDTIIQRRKEREEHRQGLLDRLRAEMQQRVPAVRVLLGRPWVIASFGAIVVFALGYALGRMGNVGIDDPDHAELANGLKYFFDGKYVEAEHDLG